MAIKVLRILNRIHLGGPIYNVAYLTKYMGNGFETKLLLGPPLEDEISAEYLLNELGVDYTLIPNMKRSFSIVNDIKAFFIIRGIIKKFNPQIVHTHAAKAGALGRLAAWTCGVPVIIHTFHGHVFHSYFSGLLSGVIRRVEKLFAKISTVIIAISDVQKHELSQVYKIAKPDKFKVVPLGLDLDNFTFDRENKRAAFRSEHFIMNNEVAYALIGRFAHVKNHKLLFDAFKIIKDQFPEAFNKIIIFLVGDGERKASFQEQLTLYGIPFSEKTRDFAGGGVVFTSWIKHVDRVIAGFDGVLLTSHNEGTPLSLIEAQAAGVPVICTAVGGVENVVINEKTGLIIPPGDEISLANAMLRFLNNPEDRQKMGTAGEVWAHANFSYRRLVSDMQDVYLSVLPSSEITQTSSSRSYVTVKL